MASVLEQLLEGVAPGDHEQVSRGLGHVLRAVAGAGRRGFESIDLPFIDGLILGIHGRLCDQINEILHHPEIQHLESAWRGLEFVVDRVRFAENIQVELVNCSKQDLADDFADSPEIPKSGLYRIVYTATYATFGGKPYGLVCANYEFGPGAEDLGLLRQCAAVAAMAHAPFIANVGADFYGLASFAELPRVRDLTAILDGPRYRLWHAFRDTEDARYIGLCLPRFLLREPYSPTTDPFQPFRFHENVAASHEHHLWGRASFAFAVRAADSFARYRWCVYIIGSRASGTIEDLVCYPFPASDGLTNRCPVECLLTSRIEHTLSDAGFIGLVFDRASGNAMFHSATSPQRPRTYADTEEGRAAHTSERLGSQLPYVFLVCRLTHYLKRVQRERIGQWDHRQTLQRELDNWLRQYVSDVEGAHWEVRARRPLRKAAIVVDVVPGQTGWYRCHLRLQPHLTHNAASFTLSLLGRLERGQDG